MADPRTFRLSQFGHDLLTRDQGAKVRRRLTEVVKGLGDSETVLVDFDGVATLTPSFADECIGRLLLNLGLREFRAKVLLRTTDETVRRLVNRVLAYRAKEAQPAA